MLKVRLWQNVIGANGWARVYRDVELPVVFPGLLVVGVYGPREEPYADGGEPLESIEYDMSTGLMTAHVPDDDGSDEDRTFAEILEEDFYREWTVEFTHDKPCRQPAAKG